MNETKQTEQVLELEWGSGDGIPDGDYPAEFVGVFPHKDDKPEHKGFGPAVRWVFRINGGEYDGREVGRIGPARPTPKNASGVILRGLIGKDGAAGEKTAIKDLVGRKYKAIVHKGRVELVLPLPK